MQLLVASAVVDVVAGPGLIAGIPVVVILNNALASDSQPLLVVILSRALASDT